MNMNVYEDKWLMHPQFLVGAALFLFGLLGNYRSDESTGPIPRVVVGRPPHPAR